MIEDVKTHVIAEGSVSSSPCQPSNAAMPAKFKGVVPQPNGHWGAQIYANHRRIWLGTFKSEIEAAMVYDSASLKLRTGDNYRNFPWTNVTVHEPKFQSLHSTEAILNMIRDGSYTSKFADFLGSQKGEQELSVNLITVHGHGGFSFKLLFQKELTPSDVGKLNRLVVPKKYAVKYFPVVPESTEGNTDDGKVDEVHLFFYDRMMRLWKFRYCYWKSSQSFVFTRGWNRFVKEKGLKENDIIAFYVCEGRERAKEGHSFCLIDVVYPEGSTNSRVDEGTSQNVDMQVDLRLKLGQNLNCWLVKKDDEGFENSKVFTRLKPTLNGKKSVRLFGVELN
ncbi:AP2/ERF and B3 domain-containing transcription factor [Actinidia chinensis var. chinensis]|uniref:AP2/ERF and B3 domain-containing transcription factor n=1 Tax=Actinidia chinensis var. chinensis TaxID=1590841 RepID=A0A2R6REH6_ACTCC|nr:AP2/ERF and B3 domain-containing transcription factor [Actinidia chinensis var. chinensis]